MKDQRRPAITEVFTRSQIIGAVLLVGIIIANFIFLYQKERSVILSQRISRITVACGEANANLRSMDTASGELLTAIRSQYEGLRSGDRRQQTLDKLRLNRTVSEKKTLQPELEYVFVIRPGDFCIFQGAEDIFPRLNFKDYLQENCASLVTTSHQWRIFHLENKTYFLKCYYYREADIYVGVAAQPKTVFSDLMNIFSEDGLKAVFSDEMGNVYSVGQEVVISDLISFSRQEELTGGITLDYTFETSFLQLMQKDIPVVVLLVLAVSAVTYGYTNRQVRNRIIRPVEAISAAVEDLGDLTELRQIPENAPVAELHHLETTINTLLQDAVYSRMKLYTTELQKKAQELQLLRSQLRPHFFLNAITTVSAMTYQNRDEEIRDYLVKLSAFMRYILGSQSPMSTVEEEISCLENYLQLQQTRYPDRLFWFREEDESVKNFPIPRFLLLTVGENAVKYGMEPEDILQIYLQCTREKDDILIVVEDNGPGFTPEQLDYYSRPELPETGGEHLGLANIKGTLSLQYGRQDLLRITQAMPKGARVEIRIPLEKREINR